MVTTETNSKTMNWQGWYCCRDRQWVRITMGRWKLDFVSLFQSRINCCFMHLII